jgi:hypothetical protein
MRTVFTTTLIALLPLAAMGQGAVNFTIDATRDVRPISRFIYGVNETIGGRRANLTFIRFGGNRTTAYNWVTNASNAGSDYHYVNDAYLRGGDIPGGAVIPTLRNAYDNDAGALITVPINGYVSADENGPVDIDDPDRFATRFKREAPEKGGAFSLRPDPADPVVYQDEFVNWMKVNYPYGQTDANRPIYFELDNEPDIWSATHPEVHPQPLTYAEILAKTIAYAAAIKRVEPRALVYGPVNYGWGGMVSLQGASDAGGRDFEAFYLGGLARASAAAGKRLVDVLDIHWYPEARGGGIRVSGPEVSPEVDAARVQAPRSLWDSTYVEDSWITSASTHGPIDLIPRLQKIIDANYPGTRLSISEYNYGGGSDISGAIAEADVLGIYGRMGVFSANEWPNDPEEPFIAAGFAMYRNFDGHGGTFGDISVSAATDDAAETSVYASIDKSRGGMIVIAINKTEHPIIANVRIMHGRAGDRGEVFRLTSEKSEPMPIGKIAPTAPGEFVLEMAPHSISTIRFLQ